MKTPLLRSVRCFALALCCVLALPAHAFWNASDTAIATIQHDALPREARTTLDLIRQGGPFPYRRDGVIFQNRERRLPAQSRGYYREYTVPTPGAHDRGARRIITGTPDEYYYTPDHYRTFKRVAP